jgi:beta-lactamase superfamily II metal-dependent hydrolase
MSGEPVVVRMYNVGFGDCFLVEFPTPGGSPHRMLIDCGVHSASEKPFDLADVVEAVIEDASEGGQPRIHVVVMTHRHQDHVRGFEDPRWNQVTVDEVWMPWTENPDDPEAVSLLERQSGGAKHLVGLVGETSPTYEMAMNSLTNETAMAMLHGGFAGTPRRRYLPEVPAGGATQSASLFPFMRADALGGIDMWVLGPSREEDIIRDMDPPEAERYVASFKGRLRTFDDPLPFDRWRLSQAAFRGVPAYTHLNRYGVGDIVKRATLDPYLLGMALEDSVNNTSLMLLFRVGAAHLLFTGDAQWGSWNRILQDPTGKSLLAKTTFYKVGHHGSHNASPRSFVEESLRGAKAMVSVAPTSIPSWKNIPKHELLDALVQDGRCSVVMDSSQAVPNVPGTATAERGGLSFRMEIPT